MPRDERLHATLTIVDARSGAATPVADVPIYPFGGTLTLSVSPDEHHVAIMAPVGAIAQQRGLSLPYNVDDWHVEKRLGFVDLRAHATVLWVDLPKEARYPVELLDWSPEGKGVAMRARAMPVEASTALFVVASNTLSVERVGAPLTVGAEAAGWFPHEPHAFWVDDRQLLVSGREPGGVRDDWWLINRHSGPVNLTATVANPAEVFLRGPKRRLVSLVGGQPVALDAAHRRLVPLAAAPLPDGARLVWPEDPAQPTRTALFASTVNGHTTIDQIDLADGGRVSRTALPSSDIHALDHGAILWSEQTANGLFLHQTRVADGSRRDLLALDTHLASVEWGETRIIDYIGVAGQKLKAAVILPPDYQAGRRYPVLTWVYGGYSVDGPDDYWLDRYLPGVYNLQLYAAHGYVILIPSVPLKRERGGDDDYAQIPGGVLPAIDRLAALGIADPARVAVMGQSFGGYAVYALVTQTNRFSAAIALSGITDIAQSYSQFDPTARGYPGIEHEKSAMWPIYENGYGYGAPPYADEAQYRRNSPIAHVDRVATPLLMMHGEFDIRDPLAQAETFFFQLYRQGKTARLLRYWGENHSLSNSPANVRNIVQETLAWLDHYTATKGPLSASAAARSRSSPSAASAAAAPPTGSSSPRESTARHRR